VSISPLWGLALLVLCFLLRVHPALAVSITALVTGLLGQIDILALLETVGKSFRDARVLLIFVLVFPCIAALERLGLRDYLARTVADSKRLGLGAVMGGYLFVRQLSAALGLTNLGGQAQSVRPLLVPAAQAAALKRFGLLNDQQDQRLKAFCAGTDNVALFFGEDIFLAFGGVLLMQSTLAQYGYSVDPLMLAFWSIPTAICAFAIQATRIARFRP
jgi:uncharacterized membrane protein